MARLTASGSRRSHRAVRAPSMTMLADILAPSFSAVLVAGSMEQAIDFTNDYAAEHLEIVTADPMAMLPFCGYNMGDYFAHWLSMEKRTSPEKLPRIFYVNWFRKDPSGRWLWPGFGENIRVLKWILERIDGHAGARTTPIGYVPRPQDLDLEGLDIAPDDIEQLLAVDPSEWKTETQDIRSHLERFGDRLPPELTAELNALLERISRKKSG